jgi:hypothetical protein
MTLGRSSLVPLVYEEVPVRARASKDQAQEFVCDLCGKTFEGQPASRGLLLWHRGPEMRFEEPPLCEECASKISAGAIFQWVHEEEE